MSKIPCPVKTEYIDNEGFTHTRSNQEMILDLVERFNQLVRYLESISERL